MAATGAATDIQAAHDPRAGLSSEAALAALAAPGPNVLAEAEAPHWLLRFARNFTHLFALLLWAGAALALVGGMPRWPSRSSP